jgi:hypothetical protein
MIKIERVIIGANKPGETLNCEYNWAIGRKRIFSDPENVNPPTFEILTIEMENEVRFLIDPLARVKSIDEAIFLVQCVSYEAQEKGAYYLENLKVSATKPIIKEILSVKSNLFNGSESYDGEQNLMKLTNVLPVGIDNEAGAFVKDEIGKLISGKFPDLKWDEIRKCDIRGQYLEWLLDVSKHNPPLYQEMRKALIDFASTADGAGLTCALYALLRNDSLGVKAIDKMISKFDQNKKDYAALAFYYLGDDAANWWNWRSACPSLKKALEMAKKQELIKALEKEIKSAKEDGRYDELANGPAPWVEEEVGKKSAPKEIEKKETDIFTAVREGKIELVKSFLDNGADANAAEEFSKETALQMAAGKGRIDITALLIAKGANVNKASDKEEIPGRFDGRFSTPLFDAALCGQLEMVKFLLSKGANVNLKCWGGRTPLYAAALNGETEIVKLLVEKGAVLNAKTELGLTPLDAAMLLFRAETAEYLRTAQPRK